MKIIFLVDWENNSQTFIDVIKFNVAKLVCGRRDIEIKAVLFKRKDGKLTFENKDIKIVTALTSGPQAADDCLKFYALEHFMYKDTCKPNSVSINIVCGGDKGYGEIIAKLKTKFKNVKLVDARETTFLQFLYSNIDKSITCIHCKTKFTCERDKQENKEDHDGIFYFKTCRKLKCYMDWPCKKLIDDDHLLSHPTCEDNDCECGEVFLDEEALNKHTEHLQPNYCVFCQSLLGDRQEFVRHQIEFHSDEYDEACPYCTQTIIDEKHKKKSCKIMQKEGN